MPKPTQDLVVSNSESCTPHRASRCLTRPLMKLKKKFAKLKSQELLLTTYGTLDLFSSIRPKVGKCFQNPAYEKEKNDILEETRRRLVDVGLKEKRDEIKIIQKQMDSIESEAQQLSFNSFRRLYGKIKKVEEAQTKRLT